MIRKLRRGLAVVSAPRPGEGGSIASGGRSEGRDAPASRRRDPLFILAQGKRTLMTLTALSHSGGT